MKKSIRPDVVVKHSRRRRGYALFDRSLVYAGRYFRGLVRTTPIETLTIYVSGGPAPTLVEATLTPMGELHGDKWNCTWGDDQHAGQLVLSGLHRLALAHCIPTASLREAAIAEMRRRLRSVLDACRRKETL